MKTKPATNPMKPATWKRPAALMVAAVVAGLAGFTPSARAALAFAETTRGDGYTVVTFTDGSGDWAVPEGVTSVELLVVGGGGGGMGYGGAGGGGGFYSIGSYAVTPGSNVSITVGAGGAAAMRPDDTGTYPNGGAAGTGDNSVFGSVIAYGGQGGSVYWTGPGAVDTYGGTSGTNNQDSVGGIVADGPGGYNSGSGVGTKGTVGVSEAGGAGLSSSITGATVWYAGGGGALVQGLGVDGGGNGSAEPGVAALPAVANLGGGGGAGWAAAGGAGGSGVVILAFQPIPEPSSGLLLVAGVGIGLLRRRIRR